MKAGVQSTNEASRIVLNVDAALFGRGMYRNYSTETSGPTPMEIGNVEQKKRDRERNACFKCQNVGCRPYNCANKGPQKVMVGNNRMNNESEGRSS